jgi:pyrroloquinoline quinone (PQQ) biosynthesis protein C
LVIFMANNIGSIEKQVDFDLANAEWAHIAPGKVVVATNERAWIYQPLAEGDRFAQSMTGSGSFATTYKLLDTAIAAAKQAVKSEVKPPALTSIRWVWRLASAYHLTHSIPQLMKDAARGFAVNNRSDLEAWALEKVEEETGHDRLALLDIQSLGYDAEAVVEALVPPAAVALIDYLTRSVQDSDPIDCIGYSYTMERLSLAIGVDYIQKVEALLPSKVNATRCQRVHSAVGADADHVGENVTLVAALAAPERSRIARACYETALMCFSPPSEEYIADAEILQILKSLKIK